MNASSVFEHFSIIKDLRQCWKIEHKLFDILLLTVCSGTGGWEDIVTLKNHLIEPVATLPAELM